MREIDFRAKLKKQENIDLFGEWFYGDLIHYADGSVYIRQKETGTTLEVHSGTVVQFTGLKDKNGVEIYEYDIATLGKNPKVIKYFPKYGMFGFVGKSVYRQFDESEPMGSGGSSTRYKPYVLSEYYQKRMEIIGNIHDNPELINEIKK